MAAAAWLGSDWSSAYLSSTLYFLPFMVMPPASLVSLTAWS